MVGVLWKCLFWEVWKVCLLRSFGCLACVFELVAKL